jgi:hypothetical protein
MCIVKRILPVKRDIGNKSICYSYLFTNSNYNSRIIAFFLYEFYNCSLEIPRDPVNLCVRERNFLRSLPLKVQSINDSFFQECFVLIGFARKPNFFSSKGHSPHRKGNESFRAGIIDWVGEMNTQHVN